MFPALQTSALPATRSYCFLAPGTRSLAVLQGETWRSGGAESQIARIASVLAECGQNVTIVYGSGGNGERTVTQGVQCIDTYPSWRQPMSIGRFWQTLSVLAPDIVYARLPDDFLGLAGLYTALHPRARFVYALANDAFCNPWRTYSYRPWFHNPLYAIGMQSANVIAVQHQGQAAMVQQYVQGNIVAIPNLGPAVADTPRSFADTDFDVVWIAQVRPEKQLPVLLDIACNLPELRFAIIAAFNGDLPAHQEVQLHERMAHITNVTFLGPQNNAGVTATLARSKVLANTSTNEGFPNTMLEAWSIGVPVVSLSVDPGKVITQHMLGRVSGSVDQFAIDVQALCKDHQANLACGTRGMAYVHSHHGPEAVIQAFEQIQSVRVAAY